MRPASDRRVTRLEEVDDRGRGAGRLRRRPRSIWCTPCAAGPKRWCRCASRRARRRSPAATRCTSKTSTSARATSSATTCARATWRAASASSEARSDIFFLEVKPFEEEFTLAQSQAAMGGGGGNRQHRRSRRRAEGDHRRDLEARSPLAGRARARSPSRTSRRSAVPRRELKTRVEQTSSSFRESTMRDPRRPAAASGRGGPAAAAGRCAAGQTHARRRRDDARRRRRWAGRSTSLDALKTADALPPEMEALNQLLKAQADVKKRQVQRQQAGGGARRQPQHPGHVEPVRQGARAASADQLRDAERAPSSRGRSEGKRDRQDQGPGAAAGRAAEAAAGARAQRAADDPPRS